MGSRVTIVDVAGRAGVAISTVSAALNGRPGVSASTRERINQVALDLGWVPSARGRSLSSKRMFSVGLIVQRRPEVLEADPFFVGFISGVETVLDARGYALVLQVASTRARMRERLIALVQGAVVDGVFLDDVEENDRRFGIVQDAGLPAVAVNIPAGRSPFPTVNQDAESGLRELMRHLITLGHRRIAHVSGTPGKVHAAVRERVWREELRAGGLADDLRVTGDFTMRSGSDAARQLLRLPDPPTAVVCANDLGAIGFLSAARTMGVRVPNDVSVAGFDGIDLGAYTTPPLTTVQTSPHNLGRRAAELLLEAIDGDERRDVAIAPTRLLLRESVSVPR